MFIEERYKYILDLLEKNGKVLVKDLSKEFNISESMIRKDLQFLEKENLLQRTYGGAINIKNTISSYESFNKRVEKNIDLKEIVAKKAFKEIKDNETIFLDSSTISYMIAKLIVKNNKKITYDDCKDIIKKLRFNEESDIFAIERDKGLQAIIGNIYQTFDGNDVYKSIEEKASNFLYMIVKNHVFIDGNKRIAATLFIYFLNYYNILYKDDKQVIDNNTLTALTILIAESNPKEKEVIIDLVMNFLN